MKKHWVKLEINNVKMPTSGMIFYKYGKILPYSEHILKVYIQFLVSMFQKVSTKNASHSLNFIPISELSIIYLHIRRHAFIGNRRVEEHPIGLELLGEIRI
jgi:thermostable 8-oxoguanine DNA glycosylase